MNKETWLGKDMFGNQLAAIMSDSGRVLIKRLSSSDNEEDDPDDPQIMDIDAESAQTLAKWITSGKDASKNETKEGN